MKAVCAAVISSGPPDVEIIASSYKSAIWLETLELGACVRVSLWKRACRFCALRHLPHGQHVPGLCRSALALLGLCLSSVDNSLYSSVAERQSCKLKVLGSIPSGDFDLDFFCWPISSLLHG